MATQVAVNTNVEESIAFGRAIRGTDIKGLCLLRCPQIAFLQLEFGSRRMSMNGWESGLRARFAACSTGMLHPDGQQSAESF